jgi:NAD(P)-dependent dehydrogenase (short-subunit alcohol dehydrogenase family)
MDALTPSSRLRLENQVAVVTGGAQGIGAGIVRRFVQEGARVVFSDLLAEKGKALETELGQNASFYPADATSPSDCQALMKFAMERFGALDCVVNNAERLPKGDLSPIFLWKDLTEPLLFYFGARSWESNMRSRT